MLKHKSITIITAIATFIIGLIAAFMAFWAFLGTHYGLMMTCLVISCIFGYFSWLDYKKFKYNE